MVTWFRFACRSDSKPFSMTIMNASEVGSRLTNPTDDWKHERARLIMRNVTAKIIEKEEGALLHSTSWSLAAYDKKQRGALYVKAYGIRFL